MLIFSDGLDAYNTTADVGELRYTNHFNNATWYPTGGRWGGGSVRTTRIDDTYCLWPYFRRTKVITDGVIHIATHMRVENSSLYSNGYLFLSLLHGTNSRARIMIGNDLKFYFHPWSTVGYEPYVAISSPTGIVGNTWHHLEFAFKLHLTEGYCKIWVDGNLIMNYVGATSRQSDWTVDNINLCIHGQHATSWDDILIWDETGIGLNAQQLGFHRITTKRNNGAGSFADWTPLSGQNYTMTDDAPFHDGDTSYNYVNLTTKKDLFSYPSLGLSPTPPTIKGVVSHCIAKTVSGTARLAGLCGKSGNLIVNSSQEVNTTYNDYGDFFGIDPATGKLWTPDSINGAEFGYISSNKVIKEPDTVTPGTDMWILPYG